MYQVLCLVSGSNDELDVVVARESSRVDTSRSTLGLQH